MRPPLLSRVLPLFVALFCPLLTAAEPEPKASEKIFGPFNAEFIPSGLALKRDLSSDAPLRASAAWTMNFWVRCDRASQDYTLLAGFGDGRNTKGSQRYLACFPQGIHFWGGSVDVDTSAKAVAGKWQMLTAVYDGRNLQLYFEGNPVASEAVTLADAAPQVLLGPLSPWPQGQHFAGRIGLFTLRNRALTAEQVHGLLADGGKLDDLAYEPGSPSWPVQSRVGATGDPKQDPATLPKSQALPRAPQAALPRAAGPALAPSGPGEWKLAGQWKLAEASKVRGTGAEVSAARYPTADWLDATVPGTALTTLIDQGIYPDPYYGLNNLAIPESLNKQDYWYRVEFTPPPETAGRQMTLTFKGVNYAAEVWLDGARLGEIKGAFIRGVFDVSARLKAGQPCALAVRVSPPPHPGIAHEQSMAAGLGPNGGAMCLDGPTFFCAEGWDWIPGIRDRCTGLWQDVVLHASGPVRIDDVQVITKLPLPRTDSADVIISVELENLTNTDQLGVLKGAFEGVNFELKKVLLAAGKTSRVAVSPAYFEQLTVAHPRLWWPNGYGTPELYHLKVSFVAGGEVSDEKSERFGIRDLSYE